VLGTHPELLDGAPAHRLSGQPVPVGDVAETRVRDREYGRVRIATHTIKDAVETVEIDRLAADLHEIARPAPQAQRPAADFAEILTDEPTVDFRIDYCPVRQNISRQER